MAQSAEFACGARHEIMVTPILRLGLYGTTLLIRPG